MSFKKLDPEDFTFGIDSVAAPAWSNFTSSLVNLYTSSLQQSSINGPYYLDIYNADPTDRSDDNNAEIQFSIAYGDIDGSGSFWYNPTTPGLSPSRTVWGQFVNLLLGEDENASFGFGDSNKSAFFALVINRARYKQSILPGSFQLSGLYGDDVYVTDNSRIVSSPDYTNAGRRYTLGSGSFGDGVTPEGSNQIYGYLYPDAGIIILNPRAFSPGLLLNFIYPIWRRNSNQNDNNPERLRYYIEDKGQITLQSQEIITSNYIFCRARNHEFNFSTQNNFISSTRNITGSSNAINNDFIKTPPTYITTVGLYNDNQELLAVAKLSKPLKKDFTTEALIRVKLDF